MLPRRTNKFSRARVALAVIALCVAAPVAQSFYLISPLSYWPATNVSGNIVFQVGLVANPPNIPNPPLQDGSASWDAAFVTQMNAWNDELPDNVLVLQAVTGSAATKAGGNDINNVFFSGDVYGETWGSSTAGICLSYWEGNLRKEADVLFNSTKTWNAYTGNLQGNTTDFRRVALHELGHALLLDHPDDVGQSVAAIMNSQSSNTDALTVDDKAAVATVFGALTPVTITAHPRASTSTNGVVSLNVTAAGSEPISYQWQRSTNGGSSWSDLSNITFANGTAGNYNNGDMFRVVVTNQLGSITSRSFTFTIASASAPNITLDPASTTVNEGEDVILSAHATGSPSPTYQWQMSTDGGGTWGSVLSGVTSTPLDVFGHTSPTLRISYAISFISGFQFRVVATNGSGNDTSAAATLTVNAGGPAPYFTWQPLDLYAQSGADVLIVAGSSGSPSPSHQWQRSTNGGSTWSNVADDATFDNVTSSTLTINDVTAAMSGHLFRLNLSNGSGNATSRTVTLSAGAAAAAPTITDDPDDVTLSAAGQTANFAATVTSFPAPVFHWEFSSDGTTYSPLSDGAVSVGANVLATIVSGANTRSLRVANVDASLANYRFRIVARNANGSDTSAAAQLAINTSGTAPSFTTHPSSTSKTAGQNATFTVAATGSPTPTLQWQRSTNSGSSWSNVSNDTTFSGVTTNTLTVTAVTTGMNGHQFRARASNTVQSDVASNAATLTVTAGSPPGAPGAPSNSTSAYDSLTAQWGAVSGATGYYIDVATDAGFTSLVSGYNNLDLGNVTTRTVTGLRLGTYYVRVRAYNAGGSSGSSTSSSIAVGSRLINLSTRGQTSQANPMQAGFFISGSPKTLLIRAVANRLIDFGVSGTLPDPQLRLVNIDNGQTIATNDNWDATDPNVIAAHAATGAFALVPGSKDSVIVAQNLPLNTNGYGAVIDTVTGASGVAIVELYETDETGRLINISTRGHTVDSGANVMIPGTFFETTSKKLLIRVVGPTLGQFISGTLADPILEVYDQDSPNTPMLTNDDWDVNNAALKATWTSGDPNQVAGLPFADGSKDAAVLIVLPPNTNGYTVHAKGKNGANGTVLVEVYEVP